MPKWVVGASLSLLSSMLVACGGGRFRAGTFDAHGYRHPFLEYRIANGAGGRVLGNQWRLDNFYRQTELKTGPAYSVHRRLDLDGDGRPEDLGMLPAYDLLWRSRAHGGVIWVRTVPAPPSIASMDLHVLMRDLIDRVSGTGLAFVELDGMTVAAQQRTFATRELSSRALAVDGREAFEATFEIADVAQLQLSPDARWERARVVLVRVDFLVPVRGDSTLAGRLLRGFMLIGYSNRPEEFDRSLADMDSLVSRVIFDTPETRDATAVLSRCAPPAGVLRFVLRASGLSHEVVAPGLAPPARRCLEAVLSRSDLASGRSYGLRLPVMRFHVPEVRAAPVEEPGTPPAAESGRSAEAATAGVPAQ